MDTQKETTAPDRTALPIAVFDSGLGGISVLRELVRRMPNESFLYYGDSANAPYGTQPVETVRRLTLENIQRLYDRGIKAAVIACNTATSAAIIPLRERFADIPVIGMEPALKPAVLEHEHACILVLATPLTLREEKFAHLLEHYSSRAQIVRLPCPELVEFVEAGAVDTPEVYAYLRERLGPYRGRADAAVLGCTHFPFLRGAIRAVLGDSVALYDGGAGTARETEHQLLAHGLRSAAAGRGTVTLENSLDDAREHALSELLFALPENR